MGCYTAFIDVSADTVASVFSGSVNVIRVVCFDYLALRVDALHFSKMYVTFYQFRQRHNPKRLYLGVYGLLTDR